MAIRKMTPRPVQKLPIMVAISCLLLTATVSRAVEQAPRITDREIIEALVRLEEGQKALGQRLDGYDRRFVAIDQRFATIDQRFATIDQHFAAIDQRFAVIDQRFVAIDQRFVAIDQRFAAIEQRLAGLEQRFVSLEAQVHDLRQHLRQLILWGFGLVFAGLFALFGFVVWDRRTALRPALRRLDDLHGRQQLLEETLQRYAAKVPELAEELRTTGLL